MTDNGKHTLKPCPFCNGVGDIESQPSYSQAANTYERFRGWCDNCGFGLDWHSHESDAIAAWNHRPLEAELVEALHALVAGAGDVVDGAYAGHPLRPLIFRARTAISKAIGEQG